MSSRDETIAFFVRVTDTKETIDVIKDPFFKRVLLFSLFDVLARCTSPSSHNNRERFVAFIDTYSQWPDRNRYSLRQLQFCLDDIKTPSKYPTLANLRQEVQTRLQRWPVVPQLLFPEDIDPTRQELQIFIDDAIDGLIERVRYPSLVWVVRNYAVHELSHPGGGMDFNLGRPDPYYHRLTQFETREQSWELFFPVDFISKLLTDSTANLQNDLLQKNINPWDSFKRKPNWHSGV